MKLNNQLFPLVPSILGMVEVGAHSVCRNNALGQGEKDTNA